MNKSEFFSVAVIALIAASPVCGQQQEKRRVAVLDFQYATVMTSVQAIFGTNQDIGRGISDLLIDRLLKVGTYRVVERREIGKIIGEQNFSNSDRADPSSGAKIGRLLGVDSVIVGDITQFGRDDKNTSAGAALGRWNKYGLGNVGVRKSKAVVAVTARLVEVNTAEILASETGQAESTRSGTNLLGAGGNWVTNGVGQVDMSSTNFAETIIGEAVNSAVSDLAGKLSGDSGKLPHQTVQVNGLVADATGKTIVINVGSHGGVHVGDHLVITRVSRVIKDPATGKPLRSVEEPVGQLQITSVDEGSAVGTFTGEGEPKVGDVVKNAP
jgi:curli biogenesis system outer membrane secretion channel CsgG